MANLSLVPDEKSSHTNKCKILIVMFHTDVYRKNEDELKEWTWFHPQKDIRYFSADFIITNTHETESKKLYALLFNQLKYKLGSLHDNHEISSMDKIKIIFKWTHVENSH